MDAQYESWLEGFEIDYVNAELAEIADDIRLAQIEVEWEQMMFDTYQLYAHSSEEF
jgi:hypothetical protein